MMHILSRTMWRTVALAAFSIASSLLLLTLIAVWVRGYFVYDRFHWNDYEDYRQANIVLSKGHIKVELIEHELIYLWRQVRSGWRHDAFSRPVNLHSLHPNAIGGFLFQSSDRAFQNGGRTRVRIIVPCWSLALLLLTLGVMPSRHTYLAMRRRSRASRGCCVRCGYDLRHINSNNCPECGRRKGDIH